MVIETPQELKRTPLYEAHLRRQARMVPFAGWQMPLQYSGIIAEHRTVRQAVGLFDVSHMGRIEVRGAGSLDLVQWLTTNDVGRLADSQVQYSLLCNGQGGIIDDVTLYRFSLDHLLFCVNAASCEKVYEWMMVQMGRLGLKGVRVENRTGQIAQLALQGPKAEVMLQGLTNLDLARLAYYSFKLGEVDGLEVALSRTGYTGEDGFELYCPASHSGRLWERLLEAGAPWGIKPAGLGARDALRLEAGYLLYGQDMDEGTSPYEVGLGWLVRLEKGDFVGREALNRQRALGARRRLVGLEMEERVVPRPHYPLLVEGKPCGQVTSGTFSPSLQRTIGLGLIDAAFARTGEEVKVAVRDRQVAARIVSTPFYAKRVKGTVRAVEEKGA